MTRSELITHIRRSLGDPVIDVELDNSQIEIGIDQALRVWSRRFPVENLLKVDVAAGTADYDLSAVSGLRGLVMVAEEPIDADSFTSLEFDIFRDRVWHLPRFSISDIALENLFIEDLKEISSTQFEWYFDRVNKVLYLSPIPARSYSALVIYTKDATVEDATLQYDWVIDYSLAYAKTVLGAIRRKHGNKIPGKELDIDLDGGDLISEGKEEMSTLREQLNEMGGDWTPPLVA